MDHFYVARAHQNTKTPNPHNPEPSYPTTPEPSSPQLSLCKTPPLFLPLTNTLLWCVVCLTDDDGITGLIFVQMAFTVDFWTFDTHSCWEERRRAPV